MFNYVRSQILPYTLDNQLLFFDMLDRAVVIKKNKNQLDATYYYIVILIGSTCFGHYYAHRQELATMVLITTLVVSFLGCCRLEVRCG